MAEAHFDQLSRDGEAGVAGVLSAYINSFGAILSLALVAAVAVWGYQLAVRDVAGVPVIRALEGPIRVQPDDPGGQLAGHQGLAVNSVQEGESVPLADRVTLAPEPVGVSEEDRAAAEIAAAEAAVPTAEEEITSALNTVAGEAGIRTAEDLAVAAALAQAILGDDVAIENVVDASSQGADPLNDLPAPTTSVVPVLRPKAVLAPGTEIDIDPVDLPAGTRLVQLGAFNSEEDAMAEWTRLSEGFNTFFSDKRRIVQRTESAGKVFYRLRAHGFSDLSDARRFCAGILPSDASCIPVMTR